MKSKDAVIMLALILSGGIVFYIAYKLFKKKDSIEAYLKSSEIKSLRRRLNETLDDLRETAEDSNEDFQEVSKAIRAKGKEAVKIVVPVLKRNVKRFRKTAKETAKNLNEVEESAKKAAEPIIKFTNEAIAGLNERQNELLSIVKEKRKMNMMELANEFKNVTQRTLRRDMEKLEALGKVQQVGRTRDSFYTIK
jgi:methyl-accepting chemotaxis protein